MESIYQSLSPEGKEEALNQLKRYGFTALGPSAVSQNIFNALLQEAIDNRKLSWGGILDDPKKRTVCRSEIGPVAREFLTSQETKDVLKEFIAQEVELSFEATCYTYFDQPYHFLDIHKDRENSCFATIIIYLLVSYPENCQPSDGMRLMVFDKEEEDSGPLLTITAKTNRLVIGFGSQYPHGRPNLEEGEVLYALTACFTPSTVSQERNENSSTDFSHREELPVSYFENTLSTDWAERGAQAMEDGEPKLSLNLFKEAIVHNPQDDGAWSGLGFLYWQEGKFEISQEAFTKAVEIDGYNPAYWSNIGLCLRELGSYDKAINLFRVAIQLNPEYAPAYNECGNVLQDLDRPKEAIPCYFQALSLDPTRAVVHHNLGVAYNKLNETKLAIESFLSALDRDPNYSHSLEEIGILYYQAGFEKDAYEFIKNAGTERAHDLILEYWGNCNSFDKSNLNEV